MAQTNNISCYRGEAITIAVTMQPVVNITGWTLLFTMSVGPAILMRPGIIVSGPAGTFKVFLAAADTNIAQQAYHYDIWRTDAGTETALSLGTLTVLPEVLHNAVAAPAVPALGALGLSFDLGGSRQVGVGSTSWATVAEWQHPSIIGVSYVGRTVTARVDRRTDGASVQARVVDIDNANAVVGTGTAYSADGNWNEETFPVTLNLATHRYELQIMGGDMSDSFAVGRIEV